MDIYKINKIDELLKGNTYPGRGLVIGKSQDGKNAVCAYFIMGRSDNSRNRIFTEKDGEVFTEPYDADKVEDPSLIIYAAIRQFKNHLIITNGNQTDTIYEGYEKGLSFSESLKSRDFEPDAPNFTPRISGVIDFEDQDFDYQMSILKSIDAQGSATARHTYQFPSVAGLGHFLHTYVKDGSPIPTFQGEPERISIDNEIDVFANSLWESLDNDNKISLYVRYINLMDKSIENIMFNKNKEV